MKRRTKADDAYYEQQIRSLKRYFTYDDNLTPEDLVKGVLPGLKVNKNDRDAEHDPYDEFPPSFRVKHWEGKTVLLQQGGKDRHDYVIVDGLKKKEGDEEHYANAYTKGFITSSKTPLVFATFKSWKHDFIHQAYYGYEEETDPYKLADRPRNFREKERVDDTFLPALSQSFIQHMEPPHEQSMARLSVIG